MKETKFKFDKGIAIPQQKTKTIIYPLGYMEVGDSMFFAGKTTTLMSSKAYRFRPKKFTCRTCTEEGQPGCRVWRIE